MRGMLAREPALFGIFVGAALTCAVQFGLPISQAQANALTGMIVAGVTWWVRSSVVSPQTAVNVAENAARRAVEVVDETTAGAVGMVTSAGETAVNVAVQEAVETVGGIAGGVAQATGTVGGLVGGVADTVLGGTNEESAGAGSRGGLFGRRHRSGGG